MPSRSEIAAALPAFFEPVVFETIGSTNTEARERAEEGAREGLLIWAKRQETGVGRRGRVWLSPAGNLYTSVILRPGCTSLEAAQMSFVTALAVCDAVAALLPASEPDRVRCKWPNDVLLDGCKISGILLESRLGADAYVEWVIVGAGINVSVTPEISGDGLPATSLLAAGCEATVEDALASYTSALFERYASWRRDGFDAIREAWLKRGHRMGDRIRVRLGETILRGRFAGLEPSGALLLEDETGTLRTISAGEVFMVPADGS